ncbi:MAG: phage N-6-adenine-methyltransferase [Candidatus Symbiopectobacterium sp. Dall1.0]|nr:phage N-6-adenine-methyltransferase [Candidatus Symbiopectobacterium sp. Dall1.0]
MLISNTPKSFKDRWQTPIDVFKTLDAEFGFKLDAAADESNALCKEFLTEQQDALTCEWNSKGAIFCNPPYSKIMPWVKKAAEQCRKQNQTIVMLLPSDSSTAWFHEALKTSDEVRFITEGRLSFISAETGKEGKAGNSKGSVLFIWRPWRKLGCRMTYVQRKELLKKGVDRDNRTPIPAKC